MNGYHLRHAAKLFPKRHDFLFGATLGARGTEPEHLSYAFPYTGHYVMRSSWAPDAVYALVDSGPYGYGHQHEDKLHLVIHAFGRQLLLDPGNYSYDRSPWRRYVLGTHGHNTVMIDGHGQHRRGQRDTYVWPKPWDTPTPADDATIWHSSPVADFVRGCYDSGYGPGANVRVTHTRDVVFVKPDYFLVVDTLVPSDEASHTAEALFHLDADEATLEADSKAVTSMTSEAAFLRIVPWRCDGLRVRVAKGEEDPVQGWANGPWRPIPTVIYSLRGSGVLRFAFALAPRPAGQDTGLVEGLRATVLGNTMTLVVALAGGRLDTLILRPDKAPSGPMAFASRAADGKVLATSSVPVPAR